MLLGALSKGLCMNKTKSALLIIAVWLIAISLVYLAYLRFKILFH